MNYVFSFIYLFIYLFIYFQTEIGKRNRVYCRNYVAIWTLSAGFTNVNNITNLFSYNPFYIERSYALTVALNSPGAMVPLHLICLYCLQPFFFEHLFKLFSITFEVIILSTHVGHLFLCVCHAMDFLTNIDSKYF